MKTSSFEIHDENLQVVSSKQKSVLINVSNHPSDKWSVEQKDGFNEIMDISFLNVDPNWDTFVDIDERVLSFGQTIFDRVCELKDNNFKVFVFIAGEQTFATGLITLLHFNRVNIIVPTTERIVEEKDGKKIVTFNFVKWRPILLYDRFSLVQNGNPFEGME